LIHRVLISRVLVATVLLLGSAPSFSETATSLIKWQPWSDATFAKAKAEKKLIVLDLEAVWCHWCHVMDKETYRNPEVAQIINDHFIAIRVDQDARPDVSKQYENWGWPATIFFDSNGRELVKRAGYIPPARMASILNAIVEDPTPGPSATQDAPVPDGDKLQEPSALTKELERRYEASYDKEHGAWGFVHKFMDGPSTELAMELGRKGDAAREAMARKTLDGQLNLVDPAWGGVYQYSTGGVWSEPHFEKIMSFQADNLRVYSLAYRLYGEEKYLTAAKAVHGFLVRFLTSPEGAFYTSQDADLVKGQHSEDYFKLTDAERVKLGIPKVDQHRYARENGWAIAAYTEFYAATGDQAVLDAARKAAVWVKKNRALKNGGFSHDERDAAGPYLGDTLAMGNAFLALYGTDASRGWLEDSEKAARFVMARFAAAKGKNGFVPFVESGSTPLKPAPDRDENVAAARFFIRLHHATGRPEYKAAAESSRAFLNQPEVAIRGTAGSALLVQREVGRAPVHLTTIGSKKDAVARALHTAALFFPSGYKRVEWWDRKEGPLPHTDVEYPVLDRPAAFACGEGRCSLPAYTPDQLKLRAKAL